MKKTSFIATGDAFITRRFPEGGYEGFEAVRDCIMQHDVKFSNLEMTFHDHEGYPAAFSGGTWAQPETSIATALSLVFLVVLFSLGFWWGRRKKTA